MRNRKRYFAILLIVAALVNCQAVEYFVSKQGSDNFTGTSREKAFLTINQALGRIKAGDTVTVLPGVYQESLDIRFSGSEKQKTVIRAEKPGTVILRGDVDAPEFKKVEGMNFTWVCDFKRNVEAVNERDRLMIYKPVPSLPQMDDEPGIWYYDAKNQKLYIHTSDSLPPHRHYLTVSVIRGFGMLFRIPRNAKQYTQNLEVDGFVYTGYNCSSFGGLPGGNAKWGIYIVRAENCVIKNCTAFLNGGGISMGKPIKSIVENCMAYANYSQFNHSGGNIIMWSPATDSVVKDCLAFGSRFAGIRFYGPKTENCLLKNNICWNNKTGDMFIKTPSDTSWAENCVTTGSVYVKKMKNSICSSKGYGEPENSTIIELTGEQRLKEGNEFADPENMDFRLQENSRFIGKGPNNTDRGAYQYKGNVFFVKPDGNDNNKGTSLETAWKSLTNAAAKLKEGDTLYLLEGTYSGELQVKTSNISIRKRGNATVVIKGGMNGIDISGNNVEISGINIINCTNNGIKAQNVKKLTVKNCSIAFCTNGITVLSSKAVTLAHNTLFQNRQGGVRLVECSNTEVNANIFSGEASALVIDKQTSKDLYSDFNSFDNCANIVELNGRLFNLQQSQECYFTNINAYLLKPLFADPAAGMFNLKNPWLFNGRSSNAMPLGPYRLIRRPAEIRILNPKVHSLTATTANLIWYTSVGGVTSELAWGRTPDCSRKVGNLYSGASFHTVSLTGLKPGETYYYRIIARTPVFEYHANESLAKADKNRKRSEIMSEILSFKTKIKEQPRQTYHVATDGDNRKTGDSLENAWRTIRYAGSKVKAGDTVIVHEGEYNEVIWVLGTGDKERPVIIKSAPGEKVWLKGDKQRIKTGIILSQKSNVIIDGFYISDFESSNDAAIVIYGGHDNTVERCFYDGRSRYYTPAIINVQHSPRFTMKNCVVIRGFSGSKFYLCPDLKIQNNVFYFNEITSITIHNRANQNAYVDHNIIFDNNIQKLRNWLVHIWHVEALREAHNCYYSRIPEEERGIIHFYRYQGKPDCQTVTYDAYLKMTGAKKTSVFVNPNIRILPETVSFDSFAHWEREWKKNCSALIRQYQQVELKQNLKTREFEKLDFNDFYAMAPECSGTGDKQAIGLQPEVFTHFNVPSRR